MGKIEICRAKSDQVDFAYKIVQEYYEAASVLALDNPAEFARFYFDQGLWLACDEDQPVGCVALRRLSSMPDSAEVKRLYVQPAYRGRGIAAALYAALEGYSGNYGYTWLYLDTTDKMVPAIRFYEAQGYLRCPRYNDNPQATIFMRKNLHRKS